MSSLNAIKAKSSRRLMENKKKEDEAAANAALATEKHKP
jgi:hypothetical protein